MTREQFRQESYQDWTMAKRIIEKMYSDLGLRMTAEEFDHNSSALLARLAKEELLVVRGDHLKECEDE